MRKWFKNIDWLGWIYPMLCLLIIGWFIFGLTYYVSPDGQIAKAAMDAQE